MSLNVEDGFLLQLEVAFVSMLLRLSPATADLGNLVFFLLHFPKFNDFFLSYDFISRHNGNVGIVSLHVTSLIIQAFFTFMTFNEKNLILQKNVVGI
jgi:hypothetical protein